METWQGIALGGAISLIASVVIQWIQGKQTLERQKLDLADQRTRQAAEWTYQRDVRAHQFQRDTLIELQDRVEALTLAASVVDNEKRELHRTATAEKI